MSKKQIVNPNDQRANVKNPNNASFIENQQNRANQLNENHLISKPPVHPVHSNSKLDSENLKNNQK